MGDAGAPGVHLLPDARDAADIQRVASRHQAFAPRDERRAVGLHQDRLPVRLRTRRSARGDRRGHASAQVGRGARRVPLLRERSRHRLCRRIRRHARHVRAHERNRPVHDPGVRELPHRAVPPRDALYGAFHLPERTLRRHHRGERARGRVRRDVVRRMALRFLDLRRDRRRVDLRACVSPPRHAAASPEPQGRGAGARELQGGRARDGV